jgi:hypothetical protein
MKKIFFLFLLVIVANISFSQFKEPKTSNGNLIFGFLNSKNFSMKHSFNIGFMTSAYGNLSLASYTNTLSYKISDKLNISADIKLQYSPFANSVLGKNASSNLQKDMTGLYLSRFSLDYKLSENSFITLEYRRFDDSYYYGYNPYNRNYFNNNDFYPIGK